MRFYHFIIYILLLGLPASSEAQQPVVWPGDADNNGRVNNLDFLQLGLAYNYIGPARNNPNVQWNPQPASLFSTNPNGINSAYADADGNGLVNYQYDAFPIFVHYGLSRPNAAPTVYQQGVLGVDPQISLDMSSVGAFVQGGQALTVPIVLGSDSLPVDNLYGFAFSLHFDSRFVNTQQVAFNFNEFSWANHDNDRFSAAKAVSDTRIDVAWVRTDHNDRSGFGRVGKFDFIIIDDIVGLQENMSIVIDSIRAIDRFGNQFAMVGDTVELAVMPDAVTTNTAPSVDASISFFPNPSSGWLWVESAETMQAIRVYDAFGKNVHSVFPDNQMELLSLEALPKSVYIVEVQTQQGFLRRQILLQ